MPGTSQLVACQQSIAQLFNSSAACNYTASCAFDDIDVPVPGDSQQFVAFSAFTFTKAIVAPNATTLDDYKMAADMWCMQDYSTLKAEYPVEPTAFLTHYCFSSQYHLDILLDEYHFAPSTTEIEFSNTIDGIDVGWNLGAVLQTANLIAMRLAPAAPIITPVKATSSTASCALLLVAIAVTAAFNQL